MLYEIITAVVLFLIFIIVVVIMNNKIRNMQAANAKTIEAQKKAFIKLRETDRQIVQNEQKTVALLRDDMKKNVDSLKATDQEFSSKYARFAVSQEESNNDIKRNVDSLKATDEEFWNRYVRLKTNQKAINKKLVSDIEQLNNKVIENASLLKDIVAVFKALLEKGQEVILSFLNVSNKFEEAKVTYVSKNDLSQNMTTKSGRLEDNLILGKQGSSEWYLQSVDSTLNIRQGMSGTPVLNISKDKGLCIENECISAAQLQKLKSQIKLE